MDSDSARDSQVCLQTETLYRKTQILGLERAWESDRRVLDGPEAVLVLGLSRGELQGQNHSVWDVVHGGSGNLEGQILTCLTSRKSNRGRDPDRDTDTDVEAGLHCGRAGLGVGRGSIDQACACCVSSKVPVLNPTCNTQVHM